MTFQSTVNLAQGFGVVGQIVLDGPRRAQPGVINSDGVANPNRIGRVFTLVAGVGNDGLATLGGTGTFFGILANPKVEALNGTAAGGPLAPSLDLPQYATGEFVYDTTGIIVSLAAAANVGDLCYFDQTTGIITTQPASAPSTGAQRIAYASNVATVTLMPAGSPLIGPGTRIVTADGQQATVSAILTGTGGNGTYTVSTVADHAAQAFSFTAPSAPSGTTRMPGFEVVRYSIDAAGLAVIGNIN